MFKPIKCQCCPHIETSQLIYKANQLTGFYMKATLAFNGLEKDRFLLLRNFEQVRFKSLYHSKNIMQLLEGKVHDVVGARFWYIKI